MIKKLKLVLILICVFVTAPISFYLSFETLKRIQATELMWFLFWVNIPFSLFVGVVTRMIWDKE